MKNKCTWAAPEHTVMFCPGAQIMQILNQLLFNPISQTTSINKSTYSRMRHIISSLFICVIRSFCISKCYMFNQKLQHYIFVIKFLSIMVVILKLYSLIRGNENQKTKLYFFENLSLQSFLLIPSR